ncbi:hypothetical protein OIU84_009199 [Salix udensis]|uniref:peroxidase n=1 Tax=Salix udensis TaxID=889485 RepID=A0AAD6JQT7_9ROSI|nr:hypothetical protein OIU84_009199 [Salix udensis]
MIVQNGVWAAFKTDTRIAASLLRLHFHDCFVNGCDASILLDDTIDFRGEKNAFPNRNSARGYEQENLSFCQEGLIILFHFGRKDGFTASEKAANEQLPSPIEPLENITAKFTSKGLDMKDVVVLSGAHTIGFAQCFYLQEEAV